MNGEFTFQACRFLTPGDKLCIPFLAFALGTTMNFSVFLLSCARSWSCSCEDALTEPLQKILPSASPSQRKLFRQRLRITNTVCRLDRTRSTSRLATLKRSLSRWQRFKPNRSALRRCRQSLPSQCPLVERWRDTDCTPAVALFSDFQSRANLASCCCPEIAPQNR